MPHQILNNPSLKYTAKGQIFFSGLLLIHDWGRRNPSKRLNRKNAICPWLWKFLPLRGLFETPLKPCPLLQLAVWQNASCCGCVAAHDSQAWTAPWAFGADLAIGNQCTKSWHKVKHLRNLGLGLVKYGSALKFANMGNCKQQFVSTFG